MTSRAPRWILFALLLGGCLGAPAGPAPPMAPAAPAPGEAAAPDVAYEAPAEATPEPAAAGGRALDVRSFHVTWWDGEEGSRRHDMEWDVAGAWWRDGVATINVTTHGIEGGDFRFRLWYRADGPAVLFHAPGAEATRTFDFTYTEEVYWGARPVTSVESVDPRSYVRLETHDPRTGAASGAFLLDFVGACDGCGDYDQPHRTVLEGRFGR